MYSVRDQLASELDEIRDAGLFKAERVIGSPQQANVRVGDGEVLNLCANNYLGLANHPAIVAVYDRGSAARAIDIARSVAAAISRKWWQQYDEAVRRGMLISVSREVYALRA